jgi:SNF2 family DNA or RNA helicase
MLKAAREPDLTAKHKGFVYQVEAVNAIKGLDYAAVFHEQGLGKTKIGVDLALLWLTKDIVDSVLVVTKKGLIQNWRDEIHAHSHLEPRVLGQDRRLNFYAFNSPARLYLTYYEVLKSELKRLQLFQKTRRVGVILDESHKIKNPDSEITKVLFELASGFKRRIIMTGTPVANRPFDLWSQVYFLDHGAALGHDFTSFRKDLDLSNDLSLDREKAERFEAALAGLFEKIQTFSVRETKKSSNLKLPEKELRSLFVDLERAQSEIYDRFRKEFASIVIRNGIPRLDDAEDILKRLLRLVQVASNPRLVDESYRGTPGKLLPLIDLVREIVGRGEKAIIWTSFIGNVNWLAKELYWTSPVRVHGKLAYEERNSSLKFFKADPNCKILIATPPSAKEGLTLTVANNAIFFDRSFSLDDYLQAQDRIHRISQDRLCVITSLIARNTVDEWVDQLLAAKQLAAQLGQGDITRAEYSAKASYDFGEMVRDILGIAQDRNRDEERNL